MQQQVSTTDERERVQRIAQSFLALDLTSERLGEISTYETLRLLTYREDVIGTTKEFLDLMLELTHFTVDAMINPHVPNLTGSVLSSFVMAHFASRIFAVETELTANLLNTSRELTRYFETIVPRLASMEDLGEIPLDEFSPLMDRYLQAFYDWARSDPVQGIDRIIKPLAFLYLAYPRIPDNEPGSDHTRNMCATRVRRLRQRLVDEHGADSLAYLDSSLTARGITIHLTLGV